MPGVIDGLLNGVVALKATLVCVEGDRDRLQAEKEKNI